MQPITKIQRLNKSDYYETHLSIINALLPKKLTPMEISVLGAFMSIEGELASSRFGTTARKLVREKLNLSHGGLGNYLKSLTTKGYISNNMTSIIPLVIPASEEQTYNFKLINLSKSLIPEPITTT